MTPPSRLECTGLYANLDKKVLTDGVRPYTPAVPLWSDGALKKRYIFIPKGQKIDASDPNEWRFPLGTKVWKEFSVGDKRMETRLFQKTDTNHWVRTTYAWNDDDSGAKSFSGGDVESPDGGVYHIPTGSECNQCHNGRNDRLLGFEQVSLGLEGAEGTTLADLVSEKLITPVPENTALVVGDDGTGLAADPLKWLHVNCGVTCHNDNEGATAYGAGMKLRLDATQLDGRPVNDFDSEQTTINTVVNTPTWLGQHRIVTGAPEQSLLVKLITTRSFGADTATAQMPPIASRVVDTKDTNKVIDWIAAMPKAAQPDAGTTPVHVGGPTRVDAGPTMLPSDNPDPPPKHHDAGAPTSGNKDAGQGSSPGHDAGAPDASMTTDAGDD
jgi:hypothetical protein